MAEKVKVAHRRLKATKVTTRFGEFELDAQGQFEVDAEIAKQLCAVYNVTFDMVASVPAPAPAAKVLAAVSEEAADEQGSFSLDAEDEDESASSADEDEDKDEDEPVKLASPAAKTQPAQKKPVRAGATKKTRRQAW